jgi:hypothetical protein
VSDFQAPKVQVPKRIKQRFVITPVDKAGNNYGISCATHYAKSILSELNVIKNNGNVPNDTVYQPTNLTMQDLITRHQEYCLHYKVNNNEENCIPVLHAIPKLHKSPPKYRFIAGASKASTKPLAELLQRILVHCKDHFQNYCRVIEARTGKKAYMSIDNSVQMLKHLKFSRRNVETAVAYDFSTLYTKLPHSVIESNMFQLLDKLFDNKGYSRIAVDNNNKFRKIHYCMEYSKRHDGISYYSKEDVKQLIHIVLKESFVTVGNTIFQQVSGIPMGGQASPQIADLTLSWMELKYFLKTKNFIHKDKALYRYIDDILAINCDFDVLYKEIYPDVLKLTKDEGTDSELNYLDVCIKKNKLQFAVYNKLDVFNFNVLRAMHGKSCMQGVMMTGTIIGELLRFARITSTYDDWISTTTSYVRQLTVMEHDGKRILDAVAKFCGRYRTLLFKYCIFSRKDVTEKILIPRLVSRLTPVAFKFIH